MLTGNSYGTINGTVECSEEILKKSRTALHDIVNGCFADAHNGIIDLRSLENFILHSGIISKQQGSPWTGRKDTNSLWNATKYDEDTECTLPDCGQVIRFTIQSNLDLNKHTQLAENYISVVKQVFNNAEPRMNITEVVTAMDALNPIPDNKAYKLGSYHFINERIWEKLLPCMVEIQTQIETDERSICAQDFFELICQARYRDEKLRNITVKNHATQGISLYRRLVNFIKYENWETINQILNTAILEFTQKRRSREEAFAETTTETTTTVPVTKTNDDMEQHLEQHAGHSKQASPKKIIAPSMLYTPGVHYFIDGAVQEKLKPHIPLIFLKKDTTTNIVGWWDFIEFVCQAQVFKQNLTDVKVRGVDVAGGALQRRLQKLQKREFWGCIEPILEEIIAEKSAYYTHNKKRKRVETEKIIPASEAYKLGTRHFITDAVRKKLEPLIPGTFRKMVWSNMKNVGVWDFLDFVCQAWNEKKTTLTNIHVQGIRVKGSSLQCRYAQFQRAPFWQKIEPILKALTEESARIDSENSTPSDAFAECSPKLSE
jgi:hypothetical protein